MTNFVAPSASRINAIARSVKKTPRPSSSSLSPTISIPLAPVATSIQLSFVDVSPSTVIRLKDPSTSFARSTFKSVGATRASQKTKASIVAISGRIIPEPFATPVTLILPFFDRIVLEITLGWVSVVIIPRAALSQSTSEKPLIAAGRALKTLSTGRCSPMTPVEKGITELSATLVISANLEQHFLAAFKPSSPVPALAYPVLIKK